jgi:O-antigen ligase
MLKRTLSYSLLALCGAGLSMAWTPQLLAWHLFEGLIFSFFILWTLAWSVGRVEARWSWLLLPLLAICGWGALQLHMGWSVYAFATESDTVRWGAYFAIFFLAFQLFEEARSAELFRRALTVYALALAVVSVLQYFLGNGKIYWLFESAESAGLGPFLNRDHYASFIALALPAAAVEMLRHPRQRWFFALTVAVLYASVIAGASRAGFVLLTVELLVLFVLLRFSGRTLLAVAALSVAFGFVVGWESLYERLRIPDPYAGRQEVALATVQMLRANPWKGSGLGTWTNVYPAYAPKDFGVFINAAHNDWLQWGAEGGIPMLACLFLLFGASVSLVRKVPWVLGVPIVFFHCLVEFPMQGRFLPAIVFLVLGVATRSVVTEGIKSAGRSACRPHCHVGIRPGELLPHLPSSWGFSGYRRVTLPMQSRLRS